jgi:hemolysin III
VTAIRPPDDRAAGAAATIGAETAEAAEREPVNGWLHLVGSVLATIGLVALVVAAGERGSLRHAVALGVFGASAVLMFTASALYHLRSRSSRAALLRRLDHAMIFVYIAGTYTPVCLLVLDGSWASYTLLGAVWAVAAVGVVRKLLASPGPRGLSTALYVAMGWMGVLAFPALRAAAPPGLLYGLVGGGVLYTVGAMVYLARWPRGRPGVFGFHELWHVFVIAASATHYWAIFRYAVPAA